MAAFAVPIALPLPRPGKNRLVRSLASSFSAGFLRTVTIVNLLLLIAGIGVDARIGEEVVRAVVATPTFSFASAKLAKISRTEAANKIKARIFAQRQKPVKMMRTPK